MWSINAVLLTCGKVWQKNQDKKKRKRTTDDHFSFDRSWIWVWVKLQFKVASLSKTTSCFYHWWNPLGVTTNFNTNKYPATCSKEDCFDCLIDLTNKHVLAIWYSFLSFITQCFCHFHRKSTPREHLNSKISSSRTCLRGNEDSSVGVLMEIESLFSSNTHNYFDSPNCQTFYT